MARADVVRRLKAEVRRDRIWTRASGRAGLPLSFALAGSHMLDLLMPYAACAIFIRAGGRASKLKQPRGSTSDVRSDLSRALEEFHPAMPAQGAGSLAMAIGRAAEFLCCDLRSVRELPVPVREYLRLETIETIQECIAPRKGRQPRQPKCDYSVFITGFGHTRVPGSHRGGY